MDREADLQLRHLLLRDGEVDVDGPDRPAAARSAPRRRGTGRDSPGGSRERPRRAPGSSCAGWWRGSRRSSPPPACTRRRAGRGRTGPGCPASTRPFARFRFRSRELLAGLGRRELRLFLFRVEPHEHGAGRDHLTRLERDRLDDAGQVCADRHALDGRDRPDGVPGRRPLLRSSRRRSSPPPAASGRPRAAFMPVWICRVLTAAIDAMKTTGRDHHQDHPLFHPGTPPLSPRPVLHPRSRRSSPGAAGREIPGGRAR